MPDFDFVIIGSGAGGSTISYRLAELNAGSILIVERGKKVPQEERNWNPDTIFSSKSYQTDEQWKDSEDNSFRPETYYNIGGNTKFYGAALQRLRESDFRALQHCEGVSPAWPLGYSEFEPYYTQAEKLFKIHANLGEDPSEPPHSEAFPHPAVSHEPRIQKISSRLNEQGLTPFHLPLAIDLNEDSPEKSKCIRCATCDPYPCKIHAKMDAETACLNPGLATGKITLWTECKALRLITNESGNRIQALELERSGETIQVTAEKFVCSAGAINSAALLLRSSQPHHPQGLSNSNGLLGRNLMFHNHSGVTAVGTEKNNTTFQKTLGIHDFYFRGPTQSYPLGGIQLTGKAPWQRLQDSADGELPDATLKHMAQHSVDWWITSEDLPQKTNRVLLDDYGGIKIDFTANNLQPHRELLETWIGVLRRCGDYIFMTKTMPLPTVWHQAGTCVFGTDPKTSVLDTRCRLHELDNCYVVDSSFMPSMGSVNPTLTIVANALRIADELAGVSNPSVQDTGDASSLDLDSISEPTASFDPETPKSPPPDEPLQPKLSSQQEL